MVRTPKNYEGIEPPRKLMGELLPKMLEKLGGAYKERPDLVLAAWPQVIGERLLPMTQAVSFVDGVLTVKVKNSTLHSLLATQERAKLLKKLKEMFPSTTIRNIMFRVG